MSASVPVAVALDEEPRLLEVARLAGDAGELGEPDLDLGVTADRLDAALAEDVAHQVGGAAGDVEQPVVRIRPRALAGDRGLEEVPEAVELVAPLEVRPARLLPGPPEHRVEVAVGLLRGRDPRDDGPEALVEGGIAGAADLPRERLEVLVDLGVRELAPAPARRAACPPRRGRSCASQPSDSSRRPMWSSVAVPLTSWRLRPEAAGDPHLVEAEGPQSAGGRHHGGGGGGGGDHRHPLNAPDMKPRT